MAPPSISGLITAAIALACGATSAPSPTKPYVLFRIIITPATVAADTAVPRNFQPSCFAGVDPSQKPIFRSVIKPPAIARAVQTTPPIIIAAVMPPVPVSPALTSTRELRISVIKVIPETGLVPTMAIALAATVVNRNAMTKTIRIAMHA